jgi:hypothetical protein
MTGGGCGKAGKSSLPDSARRRLSARIAPLVREELAKAHLKRMIGSYVTTSVGIVARHGR